MYSISFARASACEVESTWSSKRPAGNMTPINLFDCKETGAQQWRYFNSQLVNVGSNKCLDVSLVANTVSTIQPCNDSARGPVLSIDS